MLELGLDFMEFLLLLFGLGFPEGGRFVLEDELGLIDVFESLLLSPLGMVERVRTRWMREGQIPAMGH